MEQFCYSIRAVQPPEWKCDRTRLWLIRRSQRVSNSARTRLHNLRNWNIWRHSSNIISRPQEGVVFHFPQRVSTLEVMRCVPSCFYSHGTFLVKYREKLFHNALIVVLLLQNNFNHDKYFYWKIISIKNHLYLYNISHIYGKLAKVV